MALMAVAPSLLTGTSAALAVNGLRALSCAHSLWQLPAGLSRSTAPMPAQGPVALLRNFSAASPAPAAAPGAAPKQPKLQSFADGFIAPHPGIKGDVQPWSEAANHPPAYDMAYAETITPRHLQPAALHQHVGYATVRLARWLFDKATGYGPNMTEAKWIQRMIFLETVAGVPGMVGGMLRHLKSLRSMQKDNGWIHTLLEEAENERMHLLTFFQLRQPGPLFRAAVIMAQGLFFNLFFVAYLVSPKTCHAFVGFLEEEAVKTYTHALQDIDAGKLWKDKPAPQIAIDYWRLPPNATMRDLILVVRADEACHMHVNHTFSKLGASEPNPFAHGTSQLP